MSLFLRRMLVFLKFLTNVSFLVAFASAIIFIFDIEGTKGLIPIILISLFLFFGSLFYTSVIMKNFYRNKKNSLLLSSNFILSITSLLFFFLSVVVFWL